VTMVTPAGGLHFPALGKCEIDVLLNLANGYRSRQCVTNSLGLSQQSSYTTTGRMRESCCPTSRQP